VVDINLDDIQGMDPDFVNILCEGPSILKVQQDDLLPGPTVAINLALRMTRRFDILSWALQDDPLRNKEWFGLDGTPHLWDLVKDYQPDDFFTIWSKPKWFDRLQWLPGLRQGTRIECGLPAMDGAFPFKVKQFPVGLRSGYTIFQTICHAIIRRARHIRVFGADMCGTGNAFLGWVPDETEAWRIRWDEERRKQWPAAVRECEQHGITVERWMPPEGREAVPL
jgi:hypothetical protein